MKYELVRFLWFYQLCIKKDVDDDVDEDEDEDKERGGWGNKPTTTYCEVNQVKDRN